MRRRPTVRKRLRLLAGAAALAVTVAGCAFEAGPGGGAAGVGAPAPRRVGFVGDSIAASAAGEIRAAGVARGWQAVVDATPGALSFEKQAGADAIAGTRPAAAVVELGTNDLTCAYTNAFGGTCRVRPYGTEHMAAALTAMAAGLRASGACVIGVVPTWDDGKIAEVWARSAAAGTVRSVVDWQAVTGAEPAYLEDPFGHLSGTGRAAFAATVMDHVAAHCGAP